MDMKKDNSLKSRTMKRDCLLLIEDMIEFYETRSDALWETMVLYKKRFFFSALFGFLLFSAYIIPTVMDKKSFFLNVLGCVCAALFVLSMFLAARYEANQRESETMDERIEELEELSVFVTSEPAHVLEVADWFIERYEELNAVLTQEFEQAKKDAGMEAYVPPLMAYAPVDAADTLLDTIDDIATGVAIGSLANDVAEVVSDGVSAALDSLSD